MLTWNPVTYPWWVCSPPELPRACPVPGFITQTNLDMESVRKKAHMALTDDHYPFFPHVYVACMCVHICVGAHVCAGVHACGGHSWHQLWSSVTLSLIH